LGLFMKKINFKPFEEEDLSASFGIARIFAFD
jgi:hypothetical protein